MGKFSLSLEEIEKQISLVDGSKTQAALDYRKNNPKLTVLNPVQNSTNIKAELPALNKVQPSAPLAQPTTKEDKIDKWLNPSYKMSKEEKKEAKELSNAFMRDVHNRKFEGSDEEYRKMTDLYNKSHTGAAVMAGFADAVPMYKYAMDAAGKLVGVDGSFSDELEKTSTNAKTQNKGAYWGANIGTNIGETLIGMEFLQGMGLIGEGGKITNAVSKVIKNPKIANSVSDVLGDMTLDVALETVPTTIDNARSGMDAGEVAKEAGKNIGVNLLFNVGGEVGKKIAGKALDKTIPVLKKAVDLKQADNVELPKLINNVATETETIVKQSDELEKPLSKAVDLEAIVSGKTVATNKDIEQIIKSNDLRKQFEEITGTKLPSSNSESRNALKQYKQVVNESEENLFKNANPKTQDVLKRLRNDEFVADDELYSLPEIELAKQNLIEGNSIEINTPERELLRNNVRDNLQKLGSWVDNGKNSGYSGIVESQRKAAIVIGLPASGKSSASVNPLSQHLHARVIDSDMAKELLPEYNNGFGASYFHEESKAITNSLLEESIKNGDNIVLPIIGADKDKLMKRMRGLKAAGYDVSLTLVDLPSNKAMGRALERYITEGRHIPTNILRGYGNRPAEIFEELKGVMENEGLASGYAKISNDVPRGERPITEEVYGSLEAIYGSGRTGRGYDAGSNIESGTGSKPKTKIENIASVTTEEYEKYVDKVYDELHNNNKRKIDGYQVYIYRDTQTTDGATITIKQPDGTKTKHRIDGGRYWTNEQLRYKASNLVAEAKYPDYVEGVNNGSSSVKTMAEDVGITPTAESIEIPADGYGKVSKARTNTLEKSGINTQDELANKYLDESNFTYVDTTEKVSMGKARERVATDGVDFWKDKLMAQEDFASEDVDTMMLVYTDKVRQARETGNEELWKEAGTVFKKIQEVGSKMGAGVQAFAKWGRQTPEGVVADTFRNVKEKITKQLGEKKAVEIVDQLTEELQKEIYELAETAFNEGVDSQAGKEALAKIGRVVNKNTPKSLKGIVKSYLMDSMLLNFRTLITRNAGGNLGYNAMEFARQPITAGIDTAVSKLTGQRTRTGWKTDKIASAFSGLAKGIADEARDMQKGIHTLKSGQNNIADAIYANSNPFKGNNVITKALNKIDDLTKHGLSVGDRPFYEAAYKQRLSELNDLRARGLLGEEVMKLSDDDFKVMAEMSAKIDGLTATYQDDAAMAKALEGLKSAVGKFSEGFAGTDVLSQFVMPFTRTPGNIITRSLEYSPYGLVKNTVNTVGELRKGNFNQQRFVDEAGRNILGTGLFAGGIAAYDNGLITGGYSDDKDMANAQKQAGMQEYALRTNIGGKEGNFDISWLPVLGNDLVAAAAFKEAYDADVENPLSAGVQGALTGANTLLNTSTLQGMNRMFGGNTSYSSEQNLLANAKDALTSGFGQAIPSLLRQGVQTADEYQRNISNGDREYWQNNLMASLPALREELQPKIDNEGNVMLNNQGRDLGSRIVENMVIPGKYTELQDSVVNDEAMRLFESTGSNVAFLPTPNREDLTSKNGYEATDERFYKYQVELGSKNAETARAVIESDFYRGLSDEQKAEVLSDVYSAMKAVVKEKMVVGYSSDNKLASVYKSDGVRGVVNYLSGKQLANSYGIDSNYDSSLEFIDTYGADAYKEAGDAISSLGLKQSKANRELYVSGGLQALEIASYADTDGNGEITKDAELIPYLKMQNWTAEEKNRVVEQFGFSTKNLKW